MKYPYLIFLPSILTFISCNDEVVLSQKAISDYNLEIQKGENNGARWVESPLLIVVNLTRASEVSSKTNISLDKINKEEVPSNVKVIVKEEGVLDDENQKTKIIFNLKIINGKWRVVE